MYLLLPLVASWFYVTAALFLKQATERGVGVWRGAFICNWVTAIFFLSLTPFGGEIFWDYRLVQPAIVAMLFVAGQLLTFLALENGEVSFVTPILGAKSVLVAVFSVLLIGDAIRQSLWVAAALSCLGIAILNRGGKKGRKRSFIRGGLIAIQAAVAYAIFDVLVMKWSPPWGLGTFLPLMSWFAGIYSFLFIPLFSGSLKEAFREGGTSLWAGAACIATQGLILIFTLARFGDATAVNIVYSTRGLWSLIAVYFIGHWFGNREHKLDKSVFRNRCVGAFLLSLAVVLVFL